MINPEKYLSNLLFNDIDFFTGVPDSLLKHICACISDNRDSKNHIIAANEGAAIGLGIGHHIGTNKIPFIYLQNSGLGNTINPILSLASPEVYGIPMLIMIGWRGEPDVKDEPQHVHQGRVMLKSLDSMDIPYVVLDSNEDEAINQTNKAIKLAKDKNTPIFLVVKKNTFTSFSANIKNNNMELSREEAIITSAIHLPDNAIVVSTTGMPSRELFEHRESLKEKHNKDFLTVGGMGHASQISLGISLAKPERLICCFDGDGAAIMHMGSFAIIGQSRAKNLVHIVFNNAAHDSVGGQPTVGMSINFCSIAIACGYSSAASVDNKTDLKKEIINMQSMDGPNFIEVLIKKGNRSDLGRPTTSPLENKNEIMNFLNKD